MRPGGGLELRRALGRGLQPDAPRAGLAGLWGTATALNKSSEQKMQESWRKAESFVFVLFCL